MTPLDDTAGLGTDTALDWWVGITVGVVLFVGAALYCVVEAARAHQDVRRYEQAARGGDA